MLVVRPTCRHAPLAQTLNCKSSLDFLVAFETKNTMMMITPAGASKCSPIATSESRNGTPLGRISSNLSCELVLALPSMLVVELARHRGVEDAKS